MQKTGFQAPHLCCIGRTFGVDGERSRYWPDPNPSEDWPPSESGNAALSLIKVFLVGRMGL